MIRRLIAVWTILAVLCGFASANASYLTPAVNAMRTPGVLAPVYEIDCGTVNAFYYPAYQAIVLCNELRATSTDAQMRFFYAHEMAHAIIVQLDIPFTGLEEQAADELAAVLLLRAGLTEDVKQAALRFGLRGRAEDPADPHPSDMRRFFSLGCLVVGYEGKDAGCREEYLRANRTWSRLLDIPQLLPPT